jgi:flagellar basal-body rod protein FlgF
MKINRGIYISVNGLLSRQLQQEIIADNIANVNTIGYKQRNIVFQTFYDALIHSKSADVTRPIGTIPHGNMASETFIDYSMGSLIETDSPYDFAILEDGFFIVETPRGDLYTRKGSFKVDNEGYLVTQEGYRVIGYYDDYIYVEDGELDQPFAIANPPKELLMKIGEDLYQLTDVSQENIIEEPKVKRGFLESSNVDLTQMMADTIEVLRLFQLNQRILLSQDELLKKAANEIGTVK